MKVAKKSRSSMSRGATPEKLMKVNFIKRNDLLNSGLSI